MLPIIYILIVFFVILIIYQILLANYVLEGFAPNPPHNEETNVSSCESNPGYICKQLAKANVVQNIIDLSNNVASLQTQVQSLAQANNDYVSNMTNSNNDATDATDTNE